LIFAFHCNTMTPTVNAPLRRSRSDWDLESFSCHAAGLIALR
jgi:hypothetical protein